MRALSAITKRLLISDKVSFIITIAVVLLATSSRDSQIALSRGNYTWLLAVMSPFFFVFYDYTKLLHLGTSKKDYLIATLISYGIIAILISVVNTLFFAVFDTFNHTQRVVNMMEVCKWTQNPIFVAFIQQALFLFLSMIFLHVLLSMQYYWYGWLTDAILVAIISIFTPIAMLRKVLAGFFTLVMFNANALLHIAICLLLSIGLIFIELIILKKKTL